MSLVDLNGRPLTADQIRDPQAVADRVKKRSLREYEDMSKRMFRYAQQGVRMRWPVNMTDDFKKAALLFAEIYVAKKEGIIRDG